MTAPLGLHRYRRIVVCTGAGISVASGLPTFRGPGGLWETPGGPGARGLDAATMRSDPDRVWRFCAELRTTIQAATPNAAHVALAEAERALAPEGRLTIVTQNIDGLHQRAGSSDVVEFHGSIHRVRCSRQGCTSTARDASSDDATPLDAPAPPCRACGAPLRAGVVLFDEEIPAVAERAAKLALRECDLFVAIGTSGTVWPASSFVRSAEFARARTVLVNLTPMSPRNPAYDEEIIGRAEELVPVLFSVS